MTIYELGTGSGGEGGKGNVVRLKELQTVYQTHLLMSLRIGWIDSTSPS